MDVFISWSGERSRAVAEALRDWLPMIINAVKPFLSISDIEKGTRWSSELASRLASAKAGIICITPANIHSDWLLFETGALSKTIADTFVCPFLIDLEPSNLTGPLAQFQATKTTKNDVLRLVKTLNTALGETALPEAHIERAFGGWWPNLESALKNLPLDKSAAKPHRSDRELIEEILDLIRVQDRARDTLPPTQSQENEGKFEPRLLVQKEIVQFLSMVGDKLESISFTEGGGGDNDYHYLCEIKTAHGNAYSLRLPMESKIDQFVSAIWTQLLNRWAGIKTKTRGAF